LLAPRKKTNSPTGTQYDFGPIGEFTRSRRADLLQVSLADGGKAECEIYINALRTAKAFRLNQSR